MKSRILRILVPLLSIVALVIAPLSAPSAAMPMMHAESMGKDAHPVNEGSASSSSDAEMAAMPCCPPEKEAPVSDCAKSCPLIVLCMAKCLQGMQPYSTYPSNIHISFVMPANDDQITGLGQAPPIRPPRS